MQRGAPTGARPCEFGEVQLSSRQWVSRVLITVALTGSLLSAAPLPVSATPSSPSTGAGQAGADPAAADPTRTTPHQVTLITGDRLTVAGSHVTIARDPARSGIRYQTFQRDGHTYVIPSDAMTLLAKDRLDLRLFDVTGLVKQGYDSTRGDLPLIMTGTGSAARAQARATRDLPAIRGFATKVKNTEAREFFKSLSTGTGKVWLDGLRHVDLDQSVPRVNAPAAWAGGYDGTGVSVAVLDSGIDATHPDLVGKVTASANFTTEPDARDYFGHGTHVASTIAGSGAASGGLFKGVAPGATLLNGKVCVASGGCPESAIIAGMQWAAQQGAKVVNMSLSGPDSAGVDPLEQAVADLTASHGTLFVIAAGNAGRDLSVGSPASADAALAVGAVDGADNLASFSSRGPRIGDTALKPDMTAPGVDITAARSSTGSLGTPGDPYLTISGTSMATPHVAGGAAILTQRQPTWTPAQRKATLMAAATPNPTIGVFGQGAGRLDVGRAVNQFVTSNPPSISLGRQAWPHDDDPVLTRTITYQNHSTTSGVGLTLTLNARDPFGAPAPAGMFTLSTTSLSIPPGGSASVTLTTDTRVAAPDGFFGGHVSASGQAGGVSVQTPFGVDRAIEGYELTIRNTSRTGDPNHIPWFFAMARVDGPEFYIVGGQAGPVTLFVTKGTYLGTSTIFDGPDTSAMTVPRLVMDQPRTLDFDARLAQPVSITVPDADALNVITEVGGQLQNGNEVEAFSTAIQSGTAYTAQVGVSGTVSGFISKITVYKVKPGPAGDTRNSTRAYPMAWFQPGQMPTGFVRTLSAGSFAVIQAAHARHVVGATGFKHAIAQPIGSFFNSSISIGVPFALPFSRTEFHNSDGIARFASVFTEQVESTSTNLVTTSSAMTQYFGGITVQQQWNKPVYGPGIGQPLAPVNWVSRVANFIVANPPLLGDSAGHAGHPPFGAVSSGQMVLSRNGTVVGTSGYPVGGSGAAFEVPAASGSYRLEASLTRGAPSVLGTQVSAAWTFTSAHIDDTTFHRLPLWTASFAPAVNADNTAPKNVSFPVPITIAAQPGSPVSGLQTVTVQYSTNDGATWQNATVTGSGTSRTVTIPHPNITGFVSLRATALDFAGNAVVQTVIRAYRIA